jgi:hypothetical protein
MIHPVFYGTQILLPFSQDSANSPHPEEDESSPHPSILSFNLHFNTVLKSVSQTIQVASFLQVFAQKPPISFPSKLATCPRNFTLLDLIIQTGSDRQYKS